MAHTIRWLSLWIIPDSKWSYSAPLNALSGHLLVFVFNEFACSDLFSKLPSIGSENNVWSANILVSFAIEKNSDSVWGFYINFMIQTLCLKRWKNKILPFV